MCARVSAAAGIRNTVLFGDPRTHTLVPGVLRCFGALASAFHCTDTAHANRDSPFLIPNSHLHFPLPSPSLPPPVPV